MYRKNDLEKRLKYVMKSGRTVDIKSVVAFQSYTGR